MYPRPPYQDLAQKVASATTERVKEIITRYRIHDPVAEEISRNAFFLLTYEAGEMDDPEGWLISYFEEACRRGRTRLGPATEPQQHWIEPPLISSSVPPRELVEASDSVTQEIMRELRRNPQLLDRIHPRKFEELIAELLASYGWDVTLTPETNDGGYDIFGICKDISGATNAWIIECKCYRKDRKVGVEIVRNLWGVSTHMRGVNAMLATTSDFTRGAKEFKASVYNMDLRNYASILDWINEYKPHSEGKLYIKENRLVVPGER